eukprot:2865058-Lingulodinium_polyedra.AAC.1
MPQHPAEQRLPEAEGRSLPEVARWALTAAEHRVVPEAAGEAWPQPHWPALVRRQPVDRVADPAAGHGGPRAGALGALRP